MAELSAFGFREGRSRLHRMDPRFKLLCLMVLGIAALGAGPAVLAVLTVLLLFLVWRARLPIRSAAFELRYLSFLLLMVFATRAMVTPGETLVGVWGLAVTREGALDGGLICWRLITIALAGLLMTATTRTFQVRAGVEALLRPLPFVPSQRIATTLGLVLRFIPLILTLAAEVADAQKARAVENRKNPIYRTTCFALPLLRRSIQRADHLALAMAARGYTEQRTAPALAAAVSDWIALAFCLLMLLWTVWS
ncbi:MAG: energy-coupling factor transporter transmembrane protein EcfT [Desulfobacterales bacterium]|nr:energy-coupling factor transporter transmembrane protein EcfT [Desulfobacterales bacterium]